MKKTSRFVLLMLVCFVMCLPISVHAKVKLSTSSLYITKGQSATLKIQGSKKKAKWKSSNKKIAKVSSKGKVKGVKKGTATITAQIGKKKYKCKVTVETPYLSKTSAILDNNLDKDQDSIELTLKGTKRIPTWYSSNSHVASISPDGISCDVDAENAGTCIVSAKVGNKIYTCNIRVISTPEKIDIDVSQLDFGYDGKAEIYQLFMGVNQSAQLSYAFYPTTITSKPAVTWTSSNASVASVNKSGKIQSHKTGTATITITAGTLKDQIQVVVEQPSFSTGVITADRSNNNHYEIFLKNCNTSNVIWSVSNTNVMSLDNSFDNYASFQLKNPGTCTVYASVYGVKYSCTVNVAASLQQLSFQNIPPSMREGETFQTKLAYQPEDATDLNMSYSSSNPEIAMIDSEGKIKAISVGKTKISVVSGECSDEFEVNVVQDYKADEAVNALAHKVYETDEQLVVLVKNNYKYPLIVKAQAVFTDKEKISSKISEGEEIYIGTEESMACTIDKVKDSEGHLLSYDEYEISLQPKQTNLPSLKDDISITSSYTKENVKATLKCKNKRDSSCRLAIVFYQNDHILKCESKKVIWQEDTDSLEIFFDYPTDVKYNVLEPILYKIYITAY